MRKAKFVVGLVIVAVLSVIIARAPYKEVPTDVSQQLTIGEERSHVRDIVLEFGETIKDVSLAAPSVSTDITKKYEPYLTKSLLASWSSHPDRAAGRDLSSPWPDHIDIIEIMSVPTVGFSVRALLVYMTSEEITNGGDAGSTSIELTLIKEEGQWQIDSYTSLRKNGANSPLLEENKPQLE